MIIDRLCISLFAHLRPINCPHSPPSPPLSAVWCVSPLARELSEPLIPVEFYPRCYDCVDSVEDSVALATEIPELSRRVLRYIVRLRSIASLPSKIPSRFLLLLLLLL